VCENAGEFTVRKTKIVATLGGGSSYGEGIYTPEGTWISEDQVEIDWLVRRFCDCGADIIRLNLAHISSRAIPRVYQRVKEALITWEKENPGRRVAVLADLPGPKIRFHFEKPLLFNRGEVFHIHLLSRVASSREATVYVDDQPMGRAMAKPDRGRIAPGRSRDASQAEENIFGILSATGSRTSYRMLMDRLDGEKRKVTVVVGDGEVIMGLSAVDAAAGILTCRVESARNSPVSGRKGFTLKGTDIPIPSFTMGDRRKLGLLLESEYGGEHGAEPFLAFVGLSFCQTADDVLRCREYLEKKMASVSKTGGRRPDARLFTPAIVAKVETRLGWHNRTHILDVADALMVARGDLGLQLDIEEVPSIQKRLIKLCKKRGKPVITATEMLKSMTHSPEPTRAEAADVFNAIMDGSDAVMTSDETSRGMYPFHALKKMTGIAREAERFYDRLDVDDETRRGIHLRRYREFLRDDTDRITKNSKRLAEIHGILSRRPTGRSEQAWRWRRRLYEEKMKRTAEQSTTNRITEAACTMSEASEVRAILAVSTSGRTVRMISRLRPTVPVIGACHDILNARKLIVCFGVYSVNIGPVRKGDDADILVDRCRRIITGGPVKEQLLSPESMIVFTAGIPLGISGTTNMLQMRAM
jgi:pyruvate kinase